MSEAAPTTTSGGAPAEPDPRRWSILAVVVVAQLMVVLDASIVTIALPSAQRALAHLGRQPAVGDHRLHPCLRRPAPPRGPDRRLRRAQADVRRSGCSASRRPRHSAAWPQNQAMLFGARALQGAFAALMAPAALSILTTTFQHDPSERAKAFGAYGAVSGAGGAIGVLAGGILTQYASWRWCLLVNVPIALARGGCGGAGRAREPRAGDDPLRRAGGRSSRRPGLVSLVYGFTKAEHRRLGLRRPPSPS